MSNTNSEYSGDAMDWTPHQALADATNVFDGSSGIGIPDGVLIIYHYNDGPTGMIDGKPKRIYTVSGMRAYDIMSTCNYINNMAFIDLHELNKDSE